MKKITPLLMTIMCLAILAGCNIGNEATTEDILTPILGEASTITEEPAEPAVTTEPIEVADNSNDDGEDETTSEIGTSNTNTNTGNTSNTNTCAQRTDWQVYRVLAGDTLSSIAQRVGSTVSALTTANCLTNVNVLVVGQSLYVPSLPQTPSNSSSNSNSCLITITERTPVVDAPQGTGRTILGYVQAGEIYTPALHFDGLPYWAIMWNGGMVWVDIQPTGDCSGVARNVDDVDIPMGDGDGAGPVDNTCRVDGIGEITVYSVQSPTMGTARTVNAGYLPVYKRSPSGWSNLSPDNQQARWTQAPTIGDCGSVEVVYFNCQFVATTSSPVYRTPGSDDIIHTTEIGTEYRFVEYSLNDWYYILYAYSPPAGGYVRAGDGTLQGDCSIK